MDATTLNTVVGIVGIIVGSIGIFVGLIGWKSLNAATKIINKADNGASIQNAQIINNGLDSYAVIKLSRETTQDELQKIVEKITPISKAEINEIVDEKIDRLPKVHVGNDYPKDFRNGDFWIQVE